MLNDVPGCPVCGHQPRIDECWWPKGTPGCVGPAPWYAGCYSTKPYEHYVGCNGANKAGAIAGWRNAVATFKPKEQKHG